MQRTWIVLAALAGFSAVAMAALPPMASPTLPRSASSAAACRCRAGTRWPCSATALWAPRGGRLAHAAGAAFTLGLVLFCGAVYSLALAGISWGLLAPTGGMLLMVGWLLLGASALRAR